MESRKNHNMSDHHLSHHYCRNPHSLLYSFSALSRPGLTRTHLQRWVVSRCSPEDRNQGIHHYCKHHHHKRHRSDHNPEGKNPLIRQHHKNHPHRASQNPQDSRSHQGSCMSPLCHPDCTFHHHNTHRGQSCHHHLLQQSNLLGNC